MKNYLLFLVVCFSATIYAQDLASKVPSNAPFAICINGKNLNDKVAVKTIQEYPWMRDLLEKELKFLPKDLSQTGIDLASKQYQYYTNRDSVMNYVIMIPLNNANLFEKMIQSKYGDSLTIKKQGIYNQVSTSKNHHMAWNEKFAVLVNASYTNPDKTSYSEVEPYASLSTMDSTAVMVDSVPPYYDTSEPVYEEVKTVSTPQKKTKSKKGKNAKKGKKTKKVKEPVYTEPTEEEIYAAQEKATAELEETNRKLLELELKKNDSIQSLKINPIIDSIFTEAFDSKLETKTQSPALLKNNNPKSDFYVFADIDAITSQLYSSLFPSNAALSGLYKSGILNSNLHINGYFEKDRIRFNQVLAPKNEETKKSYEAICDSKIDKNLLNYIGNNVMGYYSFAVETQAIMNYEYMTLKNSLNTVYKAYAKNASGNDLDVLIDAVALFLDEKAIADLIPGNAVFVLHDLKKVKRNYVKYSYDENYEQIETNETKEEIQPDFSFLINTRNESFVNKLLQLPLNKPQFTATDYQLTNGYYTIHFEKDNVLEDLYIGIKNGALMVTTSKVNIENLIQQISMPISADFKKSISKNNVAAWFDTQKIITGSKTEFDKDTKSNYYEIALKNAGEITAESKFKNGTIVSDISYITKGEHTNSLQYFFDLINEFYAESKKGKETIITE